MMMMMIVVVILIFKIYLSSIHRKAARRKEYDNNLWRWSKANNNHRNHCVNWKQFSKTEIHTSSFLAGFRVECVTVSSVFCVHHSIHWRSRPRAVRCELRASYLWLIGSWWNISVEKHVQPFRFCTYGKSIRKTFSRLIK